MAQSKSTKKFEKNRLKDTLKRRKDFAKVKQRHRLNDKKKARRAVDGQQEPQQTAENVSAQQKTKAALEDMSVDDFFAGGFDVAKEMTNTAAKPSRSGKRKHREEDDETDEDASVASVEEHVAAEGSDDEEDDLEKHKDDLKALSEKDPEFYKYLQENDPDLLEATESQGLTGLDGLDDIAGEDGLTDGPNGKPKSSEISKTMVKKWASAMEETKSLRAMREVVIAFRGAVHADDEDDKTYKYTVTNADVYHELLLCALRHIPVVLNHHIPVKKLAGGRETVPTENTRFRALATLLRSHAFSIQHLLESLSDSGTTRSALTSILALVPYLLSFKKMVRDMTRTVVEIWSNPSHDEATRISAFLILQSLTKNGDPGIKDTVLRSVYQGLLKGCRNTNVHTQQAINLMKNTALDLWAPAPGKDGSSVPYTTAFTFIRSLALHLRNCIKHNANEAYKTVYNWQYTHSLDFWSRVLSTHCASLTEAINGKESPLRPLIYPLVQVTLGTLRLIPTAVYFPLRFHCIRALLRLSAATNTFIPLAAPLYEVLTSAEMRKPPRPTTMKPLDFDVNIRASKSYLRTRVYQDGAGEQVVELLSEFFTLWAKNIAFSELALPIVVMLRRWLKEASPFNPHQGRPQSKGKSKQQIGGNRNSRLNSSISLLVQKLEANSRFVEEKRAKVDFAPKDRAGVEGFLKELEWNKTPLGAYVEGQRKVREEKRKILEDARKAHEERREARRAGKRTSGDFEAEDGPEEPSDEEEDEMELEEDVDGEEDEMLDLEDDD